MIDINYTVFIQIGNFLIIIWAMNLVLYRPIRGILEQRKNKVSGMKEEIEAKTQTADERDRAFADGVRDARQKGLAQKEALVQAATEEEKKLLAQINEEAAAELAKVKEKIAGEIQDVRSSLMKEVDVFADAISQKILGRAIQ